MLNNNETYTPEQMRERGLLIACKAGDRIITMLNAGQAISNESLDALSGAIIAGTGMVSTALLEIEDPDKS